MEQAPLVYTDMPSGRGIPFRIEVDYTFKGAIREYIVNGIQEIVVCDLRISVCFRVFGIWREILFNPSFKLYKINLIFPIAGRMD